MAMSSACCCEALKPGLDGQSMFFTVATQAPRNSRCTAGGRSGEGAKSAPAPNAPTTEARNSVNHDKGRKLAIGVWSSFGPEGLKQQRSFAFCLSEGESRIAH